MTELSTTVLGLNPEQIKAIATALGIPETHDDISFMRFTDEQLGSNAKIREAVAYIGFDAKKIVEQFFKKADENKRDPGDKPIEIGGISLYEKNDAKTDLMFFLCVFLERGNNLHKALLRCDETIAPILKRKANAYGITLEKVQNRTILGTRHLTLARLAQAFAHSTATLILKDNISSKLVSKLFPSLPLLMYHTIFPALIPTGIIEVSDTLREIALFINIEMTYMLADPKQKRKMSVRSMEDLAEQSTMYVEAAMNGSVISTSSRTTILIKAKVLALNDNKIELSEALVVATKRLMELKRLQIHPMATCINHMQGNK